MNAGQTTHHEATLLHAPTMASRVDMLDSYVSNLERVRMKVDRLQCAQEDVSRALRRIAVAFRSLAEARAGNA